MPEVERPLMAGAEPRTTRRHWFGGSLIPKHPDFAADIELMSQHYPHGVAASWKLPELEGAGPATLQVEVHNAEAGHKLPTGDPERYLLVKAEVKAGDEVLAQLEHKIGAVYEWYPKVKLLSDNRLLPDERRTLPLQIEVPEGTSELALSLRVEKWRISPENLAYHELEETVPSHVVVLDEQSTLAVP